MIALSSAFSIVSPLLANRAWTSAAERANVSRSNRPKGRITGAMISAHANGDNRTDTDDATSANIPLFIRRRTALPEDG